MDFFFFLIIQQSYMWTKFKLENNANSILDLFSEQTVKITIIKINNNPFYVYNLINDLTVSQFTDSNAQPTKYRNSIFLKTLSMIFTHL